MSKEDLTLEGTEDDNQVMADMGYAQELFRGVGGTFANFAFTFTEVSFISSYSIVFTSGLLLGGPTVMIWGWIIGSFFNILAGLAMGEICSVYPSAGSVYHWAGQLASAKWAPLTAYICGWFNWLGNACGDAGFASGFAQFVASLAGTNGVNLSNEAQTGVAIAILFFWTLMNVARIDHSSFVNMFAAVYQMSCTVVIIVTILAANSPKSSASFVFTCFNDGTGLLPPQPGYVALLGLLSCLFTFCGYEAGGHMAEETVNARKSAPRGIVSTVVAVGVFGLVYVLGLLFAIPDNNLNAVINGYYDFVPTPNFTVPTDILQYIASQPNNSICDNTTVSNDVLYVYNCSLNQVGGTDYLFNLLTFVIGPSGAFGMYVLLLLNLFFAGFSSVTITSRITYALARDGAFPGSAHISPISDRTKSPVRSLLFVFVFDFLILLLDLANQTTFLAIISLTTIGFQISYSIPIFCRLTMGRATFVPGVFSLGRYSEVIGWSATIWLWVTSLIFFWPTSFPLTAMNMNYSCVVVGAVGIIATFYWIFYARHFFQGPKRKDSDE